MLTDPVFESLIHNLFLLAVTFLVCILITRAVFSIPKFLKYQKAQLKLMALQARQTGVDEGTIKSILNEADQGFTDRDEHFKAGGNFYVNEVKHSIEATSKE